MSKISFIYFDVGGVAIKDFSDTDKWNRMIDEVLGIPPSRHKEFDQLYDKYEDDICIGKIAVDDLKPYIRAKFNPNLDASFSILNYFVDNFEKNELLWPIIKLLKKNGFKVGLLTDQYLGMLNLIISRGLLPPDMWDFAIDSSVVGMRKPNPEIYKLAEKRSGVPAEEILFIDNREKNLVPARTRGWQTYLYDSRDYDRANNELHNFLTLQGLSS